MPFWFGACSKSNTDVTPSASSIQGSWLIGGYTIDPAYDILGTGTKTNDLLLLYKQLLGQDFVDCFKATTLTFSADGKVIGSTTAKCTSIGASPVGSAATWTLTGTKLTIKDGTDVTTYDVSLSGTTLKLSETVTADFDNDNKNDTGTLSFVLTKA
ncbi:lipocalin-like domain-containing protein [Fibrella forsythiae]|uniref:Lipocalin family protein n=1 Tax=Fibrella forsythiae TaxID=2817061 RepID=A0ABS3JK04_9BACT|nr:lipocalin family protein [Fibrella forsythiae]MBO0949232.1 lipocalin family protein [Fibrella forsythiae]